jgi:hypothetical protein
VLDRVDVEVVADSEGDAVNGAAGRGTPERQCRCGHGQDHSADNVAGKGKAFEDALGRVGSFAAGHGTGMLVTVDEAQMAPREDLSAVARALQTVMSCALADLEHFPDRKRYSAQARPRRSVGRPVAQVAVRGGAAIF